MTRFQVQFLFQRPSDAMETGVAQTFMGFRARYGKTQVCQHVLVMHLPKFQGELAGDLGFGIFLE